MSVGIVAFTVYAIVLRAVALAISVRNEKRLKREGAVEYGKGTSAVLVVVGLAYFVSAVVEGSMRRVRLDALGLCGIAIHVFSMVALFYVIYQLRTVWTMKVLIVPGHQLVTSRLFRTLKHPNYFLNLVPEFIGLTLVFHAWVTAAVGLPILLITLAVRIVEEERAMQQTFADYRGIVPDRIGPPFRRVGG